MAIKKLDLKSKSLYLSSINLKNKPASILNCIEIIVNLKFPR